MNAFEALRNAKQPAPKRRRTNGSTTRLPGIVSATAPIKEDAPSINDRLCWKHYAPPPTDAKTKKRAEARDAQKRNEHHLTEAEIESMRARANALVPTFVDKVRKEVNSEQSKKKLNKPEEDLSQLPALSTLPPPASVLSSDKTCEVRRADFSYTALRRKYVDCEGMRRWQPAADHCIEAPITREAAYDAHADDPHLRFCLTQCYELSDEIWLLGVLNSGATIALEVVNLHPNFLIQCPTKTVREADAASLLRTLNEPRHHPRNWTRRHSKHADPVVSITIEHRVLGTVYAGRNPHPFFRVYFRNMEAFRHYRIGLYNKEIRPFQSVLLFHESHTLTQMLMNMSTVTLFGYVEVDARRCKLLSPSAWNKHADALMEIDRQRDRTFESALASGLSNAEAQLVVEKADRDIHVDSDSDSDSDGDDDDDDDNKKAARRRQRRRRGKWNDSDVDDDNDDDDFEQQSPKTNRHLEGRCEWTDVKAVKVDGLPPLIVAYHDIETKSEAAVKHYQSTRFPLPTFESESSSSSSSSKVHEDAPGSSQHHHHHHQQPQSSQARRGIVRVPFHLRSPFGGAPAMRASSRAWLTIACAAPSRKSILKRRKRERMGAKRDDAQPLDVFPNAKKPRDEVIIVSTQLLVLGDKRPFLKVLHHLNDADLQSRDLSDTLCIGFAEQDERAMLEHWSHMISRCAISVLSGFNSINYDLPFIMMRMRMNRSRAGPRGLSAFLETVADVQHNPIRMKQCLPNEQRYVRSSNLDMKPHLLPGIDQFDVQRAVMANYKQNSYSLKATADALLKGGLQKVDVPARMISPLYGATAVHRRLLLVYCGRDVDVTLAIDVKCSLVINYMEVARASHTSINQQMMRGQQIKIYNMLVREIERKQWVLSEKLRHIIQKAYNAPYDETPAYARERKPEHEEKARTREKKYDGATVLEPKTGFYRQLINCFDFTSLYPSIIITMNLCFSTWIQHRRMPDGTFRFPYFDAHRSDATGEWSIGPARTDLYVVWDPRQPRPSETELGTRALILFADPRDGRTEPQCYVVNTPSVLPELLRTLLDLRAAVKKQMKTVLEDSFEYFVLDAKQAALKVICNSAYGFCGAMNGLFGCIPIAITTCFVGRCWIMFTLAVTEKVFGGDGVYGDTDSIFNDLSRARLDALQPYEGEFEREMFERIMCYVACSLITEELQFRTDALDPDTRKQRAAEHKPTSIASLCYEKSMNLFLLIEKKTYVARYCYPLEKRGKFLYKGVNVVRRDKCQLARDCLKDTFELAMQSPPPPPRPTALLRAYQEQSIAQTIDPALMQQLRDYTTAYKAWQAPLLTPLKSVIRRLTEVDAEYRCTIPIALLMRTVSRAAAYKSTKLAQCTLIRKIEMRTGQPIDVGTRIPWVTVLPPGRARRSTGANKDKLYEFAEEVGHATEMRLRVDRANILEKEFLNPMTRYFASVFDIDEIDRCIQRGLERIRSQDDEILSLSEFHPLMSAAA